MNIRDVTQRDAAVLGKLLHQLGYQTSESDCRERIKYHSRDGYKLWIAETVNQAVGFISMHWYNAFHLPGPVGRITAFCVDENSRKSGTGTELLKKAEQFFLTLGCWKIEVTSNKRRKETHRYYLQRGYQQTSKHFVKLLRKS